MEHYHVCIVYIVKSMLITLRLFSHTKLNVVDNSNGDKWRSYLITISLDYLPLDYQTDCFRISVIEIKTINI